MGASRKIVLHLFGGHPQTELLLRPTLKEDHVLTPGLWGTRSSFTISIRKSSGSVHAWAYSGLLTGLNSYKVTFHSRYTPDDRHELIIGDERTLDNYMRGAQLKIICHGFTSDSDSGPATLLRQGILAHGKPHSQNPKNPLVILTPEKKYYWRYFSIFQPRLHREYNCHWLEGHCRGPLVWCRRCRDENCGLQDWPPTLLATVQGGCHFGPDPFHRWVPWPLHSFSTASILIKSGVVSHRTQPWCPRWRLHGWIYGFWQNSEDHR